MVLKLKLNQALPLLGLQIKDVRIGNSDVCLVPAAERVMTLQHAGRLLLASMRSQPNGLIALQRKARWPIPERHGPSGRKRGRGVGLSPFLWTWSIAPMNDLITGAGWRQMATVGYSMACDYSVKSVTSGWSLGLGPVSQDRINLHLTKTPVPSCLQTLASLKQSFSSTAKYLVFPFCPPKLGPSGAGPTRADRHSTSWQLQINPSPWSA